VLLKAAEVEKGMAMGRPAIPVATLFQQAPDIFMHTVPSSDGAMVALPFDRVMSALSNMALRSDQAAEQAVPQVETPFLQVTREDTERFGTPMPVQPAPLPRQEAETAELPPVRIEPPTAEAYAAAVPEPTESFVPPAATEVPSTAKRIPFTPETEPGEAKPAGNNKFGTGEPAFPRVPASSGPPVPLAAPETVASAAPGRIPFNFPAPSDEAAKHLKAEGGRRKAEGETAEGVRPEGGEQILTLPLRPILQQLPPVQLGGNPATVPAETTISFPMSMIAPQLTSGKVAVRPNAFYAALPEEYRRLFVPGAVDVPVQVALADVLANLPEKALRLRDDQEVHVPEETFETPFSAKAAEDAARFQKDEGGARKADKLGRVAAATKLQAEGGTSGGEAVAKFDAKEAVAKACALSGVESCSLIFTDGLSIAGNIAESAHMDGLSAVAPTLLQKLAKHMLATSLGPPQGMTVYGEKGPVSFFTAGNVCLTALQQGEELGANTRRELVRMTEEISRAYPQSGPSSPRRVPDRTGG
jgi:predicted regulator of Ras-like GTPase activity (Roadblock/LC7/MglB family)